MKIKKNYMNLLKLIILNILLLGIIYFLYLKNIRICLIYNLFKIPCPGCGLTTSVIYLLNGNIEKSLQYNLVTIPLILGYIVFNTWYIFDVTTNNRTLEQMINKNKVKLIIVSVIFFIICFIKNITNPLLY